MNWRHLITTSLLLRVARRVLPEALLLQWFGQKLRVAAGTRR